MKKRLEAELISIAHRILKLNSKSELDQLYVESRKLYETLSVLKFVEDNIHAIQPKVLDSDIEKMIENSETKTEEIIASAPEEKNVSDTENHSKTDDELPISDAETTEDLSIEKENPAAENVVINLEDEVAANEEIALPIDAKFEKPNLLFEPSMVYSAEFVKKETADADAILFEKSSDITFEKIESPKKQQISFEELLLPPSDELQFEKKTENVKQNTLNDILGKNATFGLNDKIGFVKNLFDNSEEDFNRVVSQTGTFDNADEVEAFITDLVKPDYNNWENKEDYETRFMEIVLNKFT